MSNHTNYIITKPKYTILLILFHFSACLQAQTELPIISDRNEPTLIPFYNPTNQYSDYTAKSFYFLAKDSTRIAIDLYLPKGLKANDKIPTIISQTRYWRSLELTSIAKLIAERKTNKPGNRIGYIGEIFPLHGYAWLDIDVRGTGASSGSRAWDLCPEEINDGNEIVNWIIKQSWSNGCVGATGLSYSSETSERLLINQNPAVKAVAARFNPFDFYEDLGFPGGVPNIGFFNAWGKIENELDKNLVPGVIPKKDAKFIKGVKIPNATSNKEFKQIISEHQFNYDFAETMKQVVYRDDLPLKTDSTNTNGTNKVLIKAFKSMELILGKDFRKYGVDIASTHTYFPSINNSGTPLYFYSGWFDGGFANAAIKKFLNYTNTNNHLIIGPWDHGGFYNISPYDNRGSVFDHRGELLKFFDAFLKPVSNSTYKKQPKILYYTMVQDKWKQVEGWPVKYTPLVYYLNEKNALDTKSFSISDDTFDYYVTDTTATTGEYTRWSSLTKGALNNPYKNRDEEDKKLLTYTTKILEDSLIITGHPLVQLYLASKYSDGAIFVYLEDIDENGKSHYVTEGELRLIHRKILNDETAPYKSLQPFRSYKVNEAMPMVADKIEQLDIPLQPTSYLFKKGHKIRIAIAGADKDTFSVIPQGIRSEYKIFRNSLYPSNIILPRTNF